MGKHQSMKWYTYILVLPIILEIVKSSTNITIRSHFSGQLQRAYYRGLGSELSSGNSVSRAA